MQRNFSPREVIAAMVDRGFPTTLYLDVADPGTGTTIQVLVRDGQGGFTRPSSASEAIIPLNKPFGILGEEGPYYGETIDRLFGPCVRRHDITSDECREGVKIV